MSGVAFIRARTSMGVTSCRDLRDRYGCATAAREAARACGFSAAVAAEIALCAAELASNAARHAGGGTLELVRLAPLGEVVGIELSCRDRGPGIPDVALALSDGWSGGRALVPGEARAGLGSGLGAVQRMMDELVVDSRPGETVVTARRFLAQRRRAGA